MRHSLYAILILDSSGYSHSTGTLAHVFLTQCAVGQCLIDSFTVMRSDVDILRVEFSQFINYIIYFLYAISFQGR